MRSPKAPQRPSSLLYQALLIVLGVGLASATSSAKLQETLRARGDAARATQNSALDISAETRRRASEAFGDPDSKAV